MKKTINDYKRKLKRVELVGSGGVNKQDKRRKAAKTPKAVTRDVMQRMDEYKGRSKVIDKVKRYRGAK